MLKAARVARQKIGTRTSKLFQTGKRFGGSYDIPYWNKPEVSRAYSYWGNFSLLFSVVSQVLTKTF
jgi:hypothetical protein